MKGFNLNLGLLWRSQWVNWGFMYRSPFTARYDFKGSAETNVAEAQLQPRTSGAYDLGNLHFEMLAGHPPYIAGTPLAVLEIHRTEPSPTYTPWGRGFRPARFASSNV